MRSYKILIVQIRLEPEIGQWRGNVELKSFSEGTERERWREVDRDREKDKMILGEEDGADPRGLEKPQVTRDFIHGQ